MTRLVLCERGTGSRTLAGTEWPVSDQLVRDHRSLRAARSAFDAT